MNRKSSLLWTLLIYATTLIIGGLVYVFYAHSFGLLIGALIVDVVMTVIIFAWSIKFNNSSVYDPYWSVIPPFIVLLWMIELQAYNMFTWLLFISVFIWALRLTLNWATDFDGYNHEDFRYIDFRNRFGSLYWIISLLGIHLFPTLIVFAGLYPIYYVLTSTISIPGFLIIGTVIMISGAYISFVADTQLRLHKQQKTKKPIQHGLWKYSRHPNYFGEVSFWFGAYVASWAVGLHITPAVGFVGMLLLFNFYSVPKMEQKLLHNKKDYEAIINTVPRFFIRKPKAD